MDKHKIYLAALGSVPKISTVAWQRLTGYFPDYESAWKARPSELQAAKLPERFIVELLEYRKNVKPEEVYNKLKMHGIRIISIADTEYPTLLQEIHNPPFVVYVRGKILSEDENAIAIVGSRRCTDYGRNATKEMATNLSRSKITIISGLAYGIDSVAHRSALAAGGRTIAVLGSGLDQIYPAENQNLAETIIENGALLSEYPIGMPGLVQNFPARNRIISGLSKGVLVAEAGEKSGTIHTANFALEQNRQLYAIPGPIYNPLSAGPNRLIKMGAKAVTCASDILEDFDIEEVVIAPAQPENDDEYLIFDILKYGPKHIDDIVRDSEEPIHEISQILSLMEIKGKLKHLGGMVYALK